MTTRRLLLTLLCSVGMASFIYGQGSENYSVISQAQADPNGSKLTITVKPVANTTSIQIFRKDIDANGWGTELGTIATTDSVFIDDGIETGKSYDYYIRRRTSNGITAHGYLRAGSQVAAMHDRQGILLVVDSVLYDSIMPELDVLKEDLAKDGYTVFMSKIGSSMDHKAAKSIMNNMKVSHPSIQSIYIIGHVAVPKSGVYCADPTWVVPPDGHREGAGNHCGAWAADVYYAIDDGTWTDTKTVTAGTRSFTENKPNDGIFDQIMIPAPAVYALGRVDLSNMPAFSKSEVELTRQYLNKAHAYRSKISTPVQKTLVDENFRANANEAFAGGGYRSFGAMVGINNIEQKDYMTTLEREQYIFAYGTGPGSFVSAGGIGRTSNFATRQGAAYFNMLFGSFFGNWNVRDNFLRAPLAVERGGLTNAWSGRPNWSFAPMAFNQTAGYCAKISQNNRTTYAPGYFANQIHVALMGDPSLRLHMIGAPEAIRLGKSDDGTLAFVSWDRSTDDVDGYNVYFSRSKYGPYTLANSSLISDTSFTHRAPHNGEVFYMVRAQRLEDTYSGSFYNLSLGAIGSIDNLANASVNPLSVDISELKVYPNPTSGLITIQYKAAEQKDAELMVLDPLGRIVLKDVLSGIKEVKQLDLSALPSGMYVVRAGSSMKKIILE